MKWFLLMLLVHASLSVYSQVTYYEDIAPIMQSHCKSCHSSGEIGPMSLSTYDEVSSYASMIKFVTDTKLMPPFKADSHKVKYANERSISEDEKAKIAAWIEGGFLEGIKPEQSDIAPIKQKHYDYTICMDEGFEHYGIYYDQYQAFVLPLNFNENKYIKEVHFSPGNKEIVRSASISIAPSNAAQKMDEWDPRYGFFAYGNPGFTTAFPNWYTWMPHTEATNLSENERLYLPKDSELLLHLHYGPFGEIQRDSSCIHFVFDDMPGPISQNVPLIKSEFLLDTFLLEKGRKTRISSAFTSPIDIKLKSVTPLAHLLCRSWEVFAVLPDRNSIPLLSIDDWDFHWKEKYVFLEDVELPAGTKIVATAIYDNTSSNPYNPASPPHTMLKGPHMYDENFECFFEFAAMESTDGYIIKPFVCKEKQLDEIAFHLNIADSISLVLYDLDASESRLLTAKKYKKGTHTLQTSVLPSKRGRYCLTLESSEGVIDSWWFIII